MIARVLAWIAKFKKGPAAKLPLVPAAIALVCAFLASAAVNNLTFLANANQFIADGETAALTPPEPQDPDIVIVAITEDTLAQFPYRAPIDRQFLSDLLTELAEKSPRAIGIDLLFDQPTEPAKDEALKRVLAGLKMPVLIAYADTENVVSPEQKAYLDNFVPQEKRALVNLAEDQFDVVRWVYPGKTTPDGRYVLGLSRALAEAAGVKTGPEQVPIVWHGRLNDADPAFREFPAQAVKVLPKDWFENKIVLIGSDITLVDRHRTPFMTVFSGGEGMLPGVTIQAHALSQFLHHKASPVAGWPLNFAITLALALLGAGLAAISASLWMRAIGVVLFIPLFWVGGVALRRKPVRRLGVAQQSGLGRAPGRAAVAAIAQRDQTGAILRECAKTVDAIVQGTAIAMKVENHRPVAAWRHMPSNDTLAIRRVEHHLIGRGKTGRRGREGLAVRKIHHLALGEIKQQRKAKIAREHNDQQPFQGGHAEVIAWLGA